ncbi:MAG: LysR family transcriptional regulator [Rhodobacter sp.]|nr:LysR family transcriptional regulator [Rhodobacter sp.]
MLELRDLQFLTALARHRHFAKAAAECGVSQPAFSMRIRALEERLATTIVIRGNRYKGLTAEGEAIMRHARRILDDVRFLEQEVLAAKGDISGTLTLGVVPTAAAYAAKLAIHLYGLYPGIVARIETASSLEIQQWIEDGKIDAGVTYSDNVSSDMLTVEPLYEEHYVLLIPTALVEGNPAMISWKEAAELPLSLLEPRMQNRRILDRMFKEVGAAPRIVSETNALTICVGIACQGLAATVVPNVLLETLGVFEGTVAVPLVEPELRKSISLVTASRMLGLPKVEALRRSLIGFAR